jgi:O-antigen/teichoic acid export membrane protein
VADSRTPDRERFRRLSKEGLWIVLGQAAAVLGGLIGVRLLTELLEPAAYGELALGLTVAALVNQVVLGPLANGVARFYAPAQEQRDLGGYLRAARALVSAATMAIFLLALAALAGLVIAGRAQWLAITGAALAFAALSGYNAILNGIQNAARQRAIVALHQGIEPWARFLVAAGLLLWLGASSTVAMIGHAIAVLFVLGSQYVFYRRTLDATAPVENQKIWQRQICRYSWPISVFGIFTWLQLASDRWALELFSTTREVGTFSALLQLGYYPMAMASTMAMQFLAPIFYQRAGDASDSGRTAAVSRLSWKLTALALGATGAVFLLALLFHRQIFSLLVAREYAHVSGLLPWMLLAGGIFAAGQSIALNLMSQMRTQAMMVAKIVTAILGTALNLAGAYWLGTAGIVIAAVLFSVLYFAWMALLSVRSPRRRLF